MKKPDWLFQISRQNERTNEKKSGKTRKNPDWLIRISRRNSGVLLVLLVVCCLFGRTRTSPLVSAFTTTDSLSFQHLAVNQQTGQVYVGGVNRIYQLSADLETLVAVETGPRDDSPDCPAVDCSPSVVRTTTDNYNKVLVVDEADDRLIVCGSLFQGICTIRSLQNVSEQLQEVHEPVAANSATASTVAFIGPGPASLSSGTSATRVLYAGVTYTANSPYRSEVPAVSSRSLRRDDMLQIAKTDVTTGTRIAINSLERERYPIRYVSGFSSGGFSYFLTTQRRATHANSPYISKLIRVCQNDTEYYSYTEVPLECAIENGIRYNLVQAAYVGKPGADLASQLKIQAQDDVLFAAFSPSDAADGETSSRASRQQSALCVYSLQSIRRKFMKNIQTCFNGEGSKGLDYISPNLPCIHTKLETIAEDFCGMDVNTPLGGEDPVAEAPVATFDVQVTAVAATSIGEFTVAFLGTVDGHLKKVVVESGRADWSRGGGAAEYSDAVIDEGSPVNPDLHLDPQKNHIYVMTTKKVTKVRVQDCGIHKNCGECLGARDPYCGWCSLENKCSLRSDCQDASKDPLYWISYKSGRCTTITSVTPHQLQRTTARTLSLVIDNLPSLSGQFQCAFSAFGKTLLTNATRTTTGVSCVTPRTDLIPPNLPGQHHFTAKLSVRVASGPDFVATNFTFFDCNTYASCSDCVSSAFPCDWCVDGHRCTHDTGENCRNDVLVTGVSRIGPSIQSGPAFCPRISSATGNGVEILVPHGMKKIVKVKVDNIAQFIVQTSFVCQFNIEGRVKMVPAQLIGDTVYCDSMEFSYSSKQPNITATFAVVWAGTKALDNPDNVRVLVYRCREMADNCGVCLALDEKFQCGWCQTSDSCDVRDQCDRGSVVGGSSLAAAGGSWLNRDQICPNPEIRRFFPVVGPWEGGTNITIEGVNLGRSLEDVGGAVSVAGMPCIPDASLYVPSRRIVCSVEGPKTSDARKGPVVVNVATKFKGISAENFEFVDPVIESVTPLKGPRSGGTLLTIMGQHMDAGSLVQAWIDPSLPCTILSRNSTHALCRTSSSEILRNGTLHMSFDLGTRSFRKDLYEYVEDPSVKYAESGVSARAVPKGVPAGGIGITVVGNNFGFVQDPKMYVILRDTKYVSQCQVVNSQRMNCESPAVPILGQQIPPDEPLHLDYGFLMDDVASVLNLSRAPGFSYFLLYPDPVFEKFDEEIKYYKSDYLTINGQHLDRACQESDVEVMIGTVPCNVTSLSRYQLTCRPPASQPPAAGSDPDDVPEVVVIVGKSKRHVIGKLSYESPIGIEAQLPKNAVIGIAVGSALLLIILIAIVIAYRRKSTENSRVLKTMQEHMDMLELQVAAECKEAFAELQTEMTDLTSDLTSGGIPFLDYRTYAMKILFPSQDDPSLLQWDNSPELLRKEKGLRLFGHLLMNKTFLLVFIRTLESNRYFYMRDRVNVASLIMVTLQTKMEYCTDILKTLLADLIEKCMEGKSHPKLLLRRTESVAEKMLSAWFTFLLYKFLRECAGEPLYLLFRAIKHQVDKGPVDCVTSEARYSLSEEKLIRQSIEYKHMTVYVSISPQTMYVAGLDAHTDTNDTPVKVLDCDTVSQVKEKALDTIYRSTPYSQRPRKEDLDLEWRTGTSGRMVIFNEDSTSKSENDWKKLNTLAHYRVPDGALLTLIPRQSSMYFILPEKSNHATEKSLHKYETLNLNLSKFSSASPPVSRATSPMNHQGDKGHESEHGLKVWHLVRHQDHEGRKEGERANKMVSEIYLTRLLSTKITLQKYVDDLFETIFSTANRGSSLPLAIKYMFDFLDDQALQHGITDPEVVHTWKSNSLPLRFWVNLIKNPNFVFDVHKSNIVDSCLSVVAQTFMDSCSTSDHRLGKDSPSSKLLFAKDIPVYKEWVDRYYSDIKTMPAISDQEMNAMLAEESRQHLEDFNLNCALNELYGYAVRYQEQLTLALEEDEFSTKQRLAYRLEQVHVLMRPDTTNP